MGINELEKGDVAVISLKQAAEILSIDYRTARSGCIDGQIPHLQIGRKRLVLVRPFLEMLKTGRGDFFV